MVLGRTIELSPVPVKVNFYEENPLRGKSELALPKRYTLVGNEVTIVAEPYYSNTEDQNTLEEWRLNGRVIDSAGPKNRFITLTAETNSGSGSLSYLLQSLSNYTERASKEINIFFNQAL